MSFQKQKSFVLKTDFLYMEKKKKTCVRELARTQGMGQGM